MVGVQPLPLIIRCTSVTGSACDPGPCPLSERARGCQECRCNYADQVQACCVKIVAIILDLTNMKDAHAVRRQMLSLALILALQGFVGSADGVPSSSALNICTFSGPGLLRVAMMMQQIRLRRCDCSGCFGNASHKVLHALSCCRPCRCRERKLSSALDH